MPLKGSYCYILHSRYNVHIFLMHWPEIQIPVFTCSDQTAGSWDREQVLMCLNVHCWVKFLIYYEDQNLKLLLDKVSSCCLKMLECVMCDVVLTADCSSDNFRWNGEVTWAEGTIQTWFVWLLLPLGAWLADRFSSYLLSIIKTGRGCPNLQIFVFCIK